VVIIKPVISLKALKTEFKTKLSGVNTEYCYTAPRVYDLCIHFYMADAISTVSLQRLEVYKNSSFNWPLCSVMHFASNKHIVTEKWGLDTYNNNWYLRFRS